MRSFHKTVSSNTTPEFLSSVDQFASSFDVLPIRADGSDNGAVTGVGNAADMSLTSLATGKVLALLAPLQNKSFPSRGSKAYNLKEIAIAVTTNGDGVLVTIFD